MIENGTFAWETPETRKSCEDFSLSLEARFGPAKRPGKPTGPAIQANPKAEQKIDGTASPITASPSSPEKGSASCVLYV